MKEHSLKTVIFNGSPRKGGDTAFLVESIGRIAARRSTGGFSAYREKITACQDCRYCCTHVGCCIADDMQKIYPQIVQADNIVIASPVYFSELTGPLLSMLSRLQAFYGSRRFLQIEQITKPKRGALVLCGGGDGEPGNAQETAAILLQMMNASLCQRVCSLRTDTLPSREDEEALRRIHQLAKLLQERRAE